MTSNADGVRPDDESTEDQQAQAANSAATPQPGDSAEGEQSHTESAQSMQDALTQAQNKAAEYYDQLLRAQAEMENVRRRAQEDVAKARKFGIESFAEGLVPVKDSLEAALSQAEQSAQDMREGIETTLKQLSAAFDRNHLTEISPATGEKFDPHHHQAIATVPSDQPANTVVAVLQKGYLIADRVLRPALVTVAG